MGISVFLFVLRSVQEMGKVLILNIVYFFDQLNFVILEYVCKLYELLY